MGKVSGCIERSETSSGAGFLRCNANDMEDMLVYNKLLERECFH